MPIDWKVIHDNLAAFPQSELTPYAGHWVAWSFDGTRIVASSAESWEAVYRILQARAERATECLVPSGDHPRDENNGAVTVSRPLEREKDPSPPTGCTSRPNQPHADF